MVEFTSAAKDSSNVSFLAAGTYGAWGCVVRQGEGGGIKGEYIGTNRNDGYNESE